MNLPKSILVGNGGNNKKKYYLWDVYFTWEEAITMAKRLKGQRKEKIKHYILKTDKGKCGLYFDKKMRIQ